MPQRHLNYFVTRRRPSPAAFIIDLAILLAAVITVNCGILVAGWRAPEIDRSLYVFAFGPANALIAIVALACTPVFTRLSGRSGRVHVLLSLAVPVAALVTWALVFMSNTR